MQESTGIASLSVGSYWQAGHKRVLEPDYKMVASAEVMLDLGVKALIVDDDLDVLSTMADVLRGRGYDVEIAQTAEEGLNRLGASPFQLVISDYKLPGNTGAWMIQEATKAGLLASAKVLLITGEANPEGVSGLKILRKPFEIDHFLREVNRDRLEPPETE